MSSVYIRRPLVSTLTPKPVPAVASSDCTPFVVCILMKIYSFRSRLQIVSVLTITVVHLGSNQGRQKTRKSKSIDV